MLAYKMALPTVVTCPVYYLKPEQSALQHTLAAIRLNQPVDKLPATAFAPGGAHFVNAAEMETRYPHFPAALAASSEIAARCKFELPLGVAHMPTVPLPPGLTAADVLRRKAEEGANRLYGKINPAVRERLDHELDVIARMGYEPIFLIVEEILDFARQTSVPFSSRGSAASSLVAHCLGITSPDPIRLDLFFERFLNPARTTPPDIDTDLCSRRSATASSSTSLIPTAHSGSRWWERSTASGHVQPSGMLPRHTVWLMTGSGKWSTGCLTAFGLAWNQPKREGTAFFICRIKDQLSFPGIQTYLR